MASNGTIKSQVYTYTDTVGEAYWALDWSATTSGLAAGYTQINYTLYKERQYAANSPRISTGCALTIKPVSGTMESPTFTENKYAGDQNGAEYTPTGASASRSITNSKLYVYTGHFSYKDKDDSGSLFGVQGSDRTVYGTGSFIIKHNNSGYGSFSVTLDVHISITPGTTPLSKTSTFALDTNIYYSSVTNPHEYSFSSKVGVDNIHTDLTTPVQKGEKLCFIWYGASDGVNNPIKEYELYVYQQEKNPIESMELNNLLLKETISKGEDDTWQEALITIPDNAKEGWWISYGVKSIPTMAGYGETSPSFSVYSFLINTPPEEPAITTTQTHVATVESTVVFSGTPGEDNEYKNWNGESVAFEELINVPAPSLAYALSPTGAKQIISNPSNFNITIPEGTSNPTIYFYTYDGQEYSSPTTITLTRNVKPKVNIIASENNTLVATKNVTEYKYLVSSNLTASNVSGTGYDSNNKYQFGIQYNTTGPSGSWTSVLIRDAVSSINCVISDVRDSISNFSSTLSGYYFRFYARRHDSLEWSDLAYSNIYYIPPKPDLKGIYNQSDCQNISNENLNGYFSTILSFEFDRDDGYQMVELTSPIAKAGTLKTSSDNATTMYVNIENIGQSELVGGTTYKFNFNLKRQNKTYYATNFTSNNTMTRVKTFGQTNLQNNFSSKTNACKIYTYSGNITFIVTLSALGGGTLDLGNMSTYGITNFYENCSLILKKGEEKNILPLTLTGSKFTAISDISYVLTLFANEGEVDSFYNILPPSLDRNSIADIEIGFRIRDDFGGNIEFYDLNNLWLNFVEDVIFSNDSAIFISKKGQDSYIILDPAKYFLKEGMTLSYKGTISSYNTSPIGQIQINRNDGMGWVNYGNSFNFIPKSSTLSRNNPMDYYIESNQEFSTLDRIIRQDYMVDFRIAVTAAGNTTTLNIMEDVAVKEHQPGSIRFNNITYSKTDKTLDLSYIIFNPGADLMGNSSYITIKPRFDWRGQNDGGTIEYSSYCSSEEVSGYGKTPYSHSITRRLTLTDSKGNAIEDSAFYGTIVVEVIFRYTIGDLTFETTYETISLEVTIYNEAPTVSLRQNKLGINTNIIDSWEDGVLVISAINSEQRKILIVNPESDPNDLKTVLSIDTYTREIDGAIINGGSW